jgi:hypothetical protein
MTASFRTSAILAGLIAWMIFSGQTMPAIVPATQAATKPVVLVPDYYYSAWTGFKPGSSVTYAHGASGVGEDGVAFNDDPEKLGWTLEWTLQDIDGERVKIAQKETSGGRVHNRDIAIGKTSKEDSVTQWRPLIREGDEEIEIMGKKMKTHWYESESVVVDTRNGTTDTETFHTKTWMNTTVPGGIVKREFTLKDEWHTQEGKDTKRVVTETLALQHFDAK